MNNKGYKQYELSEWTIVWRLNLCATVQQKEQKITNILRMTAKHHDSQKIIRDIEVKVHRKYIVVACCLYYTKFCN